jgi:hypothetical protein
MPLLVTTPLLERSRTRSDSSVYIFDQMLAQVTSFALASRGDIGLKLAADITVTPADFEGETPFSLRAARPSGF